MHRHAQRRVRVCMDMCGSVRECTVVDKGTGMGRRGLGMRGHVRVCATWKDRGQGKASDE